MSFSEPVVGPGRSAPGRWAAEAVPLLRIRYTAPSSVEVSATSAHLSVVGQSILEVAAGKRPSAEFLADIDFDPAPYEGCLVSLVVVSADGPTKVETTPDSALHVSGAPNNLESFASFLDCEPGSHKHYEYYEAMRG